MAASTAIMAGSFPYLSDFFLCVWKVESMQIVARKDVGVEQIPTSSKIALSSLLIFVNDGIYYCCNANISF